jgi:hypothetical protein
MGYIEIVTLQDDGVLVQDLSEVSASVEQELWTALKKGDVK